MNGFKFFKPLPGMLPCECPKCHNAVTDPETATLVQENTFGGGNCVLHSECLDSVLNNPQPTETT